MALLFLLPATLYPGIMLQGTILWFLQAFALGVGSTDMCVLFYMIVIRLDHSCLSRIYDLDMDEGDSMSTNESTGQVRSAPLEQDIASAAPDEIQTLKEESESEDKGERAGKSPQRRKISLSYNICRVQTPSGKGLEVPPAADKVGQACIALKANRARPEDAEYGIRIHFITAASQSQVRSLLLAEHPEHWESTKQSFDFSHETLAGLAKGKRKPKLRRAI